MSARVQEQKELKDMTISVCGDALSSMRLGSAYNCFTKQRGPSVFSGKVNEESFSHVETDCKQISGIENIETVLENSSAGEIQIWTKKLAGLGYQSKSSGKHSASENWFLYTNTYIKKRRWIEGPVSSTNNNDTHYLGEIQYGGYLFIVMSSTEIDDEMSAERYIEASLGAGKERGLNARLSHSGRFSTGSRMEWSHVKQAKVSSHVGSLETDGDKSLVEIFENQSRVNEDLVPVKLGLRRLRDHVNCFPVPKRELKDMSSYLEEAMTSLTTTDGYSRPDVAMVENLQRKLKVFVGNVYDGHSLSSPTSITTEYDDVLQKLPGMSLEDTAVNVDRFILPFEPTTSDETRRVLLLGRVSAGKSTFGNYLVNGEAFTVGKQTSSVTRSYQVASTVMNIGGQAQKLEVIDVPGFFDPAEKNELATTEIAKGLKDYEEVHAIIWVIRAIWYEEAVRQLNKFEKKLRVDDIEDYCIMVITHMNDEDSIPNLIKKKFKYPAELVENRVIGARDFAVGLPDSETRRTREAVMTMVNDVEEHEYAIEYEKACAIM